MSNLNTCKHGSNHNWIYDAMRTYPHGHKNYHGVYVCTVCGQVSVKQPKGTK